MKLSIHPNIIGKPEKVEKKGQKPYFRCNGKVINQGYGWMNIEVDNWEQAFELITTDGYATSCELKTDHRDEANYISRQICMVDIDEGMTLQELLVDDFYNEYGAGFYTTARHTNDAHRFRIIFVLDNPEYDAFKMRKIIRGLLMHYKSGDTNCKDASRIYYGVANCAIKECRNKTLPNIAVDVLTELVDIKDNEEIKYTEFHKDYDTQYDEIFVSNLLSKIANKVGNLHGEYNTWLNIAWATCHTVGAYVAKQLMLQYWPSKSKKELHAFDSWNMNKSPTIGTLIKLSGIDGKELQILERDFKHRNNIPVILSPQEAIYKLNKKIKVY